MRFCIIPPRTCQSTLVISARLHNVKVVFAGAIGRKGDEPPIRGPCRVFTIKGFRSQLARLPAVRRNSKYRKPITDTTRVNDSITSRRPLG